MREAIVKIVLMLSMKKVRVTQQGTSAFVQYDTRTNAVMRVNLPYLPDDATDELLDAIQGFLDHEVAHILYTDNSVGVEAKHKKIHNVWNIVEDSMIEKRMTQAFKGSGLNLSNVGRFVLKEYIDKALAKEPAKANSILMMPAIRAWAGQAVFKDYMADKWNLISRLTAKLGKDIGDVISKCESSADCLAAALEIQRRLKATPETASMPGMGESIEGEEPGEGEASEAGEAGDDLGESDSDPKAKKVKGKPKAKPEGDSKDKPSKEKKEPKGKKGDDKADDKGEDEPEKDKKKKESKDAKKADKGAGPETDAAGDDKADDEEGPKGSGAGGDDAGEPGTTPDDLDLDDADDEAGGGKSGDEDDDSAEEGGAGKGDAGSDVDPSAVHDDEPMGTEPKMVDKKGGTPGSIGDFSHDPTLAKEIEDSPPIEFDEAMAELISERARREAKDSDYLIYTRDYDEVAELEVPRSFDDTQLKRMVDKVDHMVAPLQKDIERAIAARSQVIWTGGHRRGKLHTAALSRLTFGRDDVFRRKNESTSKDVAVELVVDQSGSMGGGRSGSGTKIQNAAYAAYAFSAVLDRLNIAHEVVAFTTKDMPSDAVHRAMAEQVKMGCRYGRLEAIWMPIIKPFNERLTVESKRRFAYLAQGPGMAENVDGESVQMAAQRLAMRRETRKILMVFSDGHPACSGDFDQLNSHLRQVVKEITKRKIDVIGIGIQSSAVTSFYPKNVVINDVSELPGECMKQLKALLTR